MQGLSLVRTHYSFTMAVKGFQKWHSPNTEPANFASKWYFRNILFRASRLFSLFYLFISLAIIIFKSQKLNWVWNSWVYKRIPRNRSITCCICDSVLQRLFQLQLAVSILCSFFFFLFFPALFFFNLLDYLLRSELGYSFLELWCCESPAILFTGSPTTLNLMRFTSKGFWLGLS